MVAIQYKIGGILMYDVGFLWLSPGENTLFLSECVCLFVDTKMSTLSEIGQQISFTCNVRSELELLHTS